MVSVGPGTINTSNGGGGKNREFEYAKKNGLSTIHSTFKFTPSKLRLKIAHYSQYVNLCWSLHSQSYSCC